MKKPTPVDTYIRRRVSYKQIADKLGKPPWQAWLLVCDVRTFKTLVTVNVSNKLDWELICEVTDNSMRIGVQVNRASGGLVDCQLDLIAMVDTEIGER